MCYILVFVRYALIMSRDMPLFRTYRFGKYPLKPPQTTVVNDQMNRLPGELAPNF